MKKILAISLLLILFVTGCGSVVPIDPKPDYNLIPVYTLDQRNAYLNASTTPLEFFSVTCSTCQKDLPEVQKMVQEIKSQKPVVYVATFFKTKDLNEAIKQTKDFISKYKIEGTVVIQAGPPTEYVNKVPAFVSMGNDKKTPDVIEGLPSKDKLAAILMNTTKPVEAKK